MENKIVPCEIPSEIPMEEREQVRLVERFLCTGGSLPLQPVRGFTPCLATN